jgi:SAM-dependent methyltransferase
MYEKLAEYYDWEHRAFLEDLPMYTAFASAASGDVLDAACGTGRILAPLAAAGHRVTGVDSSNAMLEVARERVRAARVARKVSLVQADLRTFDLGREFGMALIALGSFHHILTTGDQRAALAALAAHLKPKGLLVLDLINPTPEWLSAADGALVHQLTAPFPHSDGPDRLTKLVARSGSFDAQMDHQIMIYDRISPEGAVTRRVFEMEMRYLFRYETEILLDEAGLGVRAIYGGYNMEQYDTASTRMIFVAEKR